MSGANLVRPRGVTAHEVCGEPAFHVGVDDWRSGLPPREYDLPPLIYGRDNLSNRQRIYETGRLVAAFARAKRRKVDPSTAIAAKKQGYLP